MHQTDSNASKIHYTIKGEKIVFLNNAFILAEAITEVKRGENCGKTFSHINIVKDLQITEAHGSGTLKLNIPKEHLNKPFKVISFTRDKESLKILGVHEAIFE